MTGEDLFQMLQQMSPEQRQSEVMVQVPAGEYESYFTQSSDAKILKIDGYTEKESGIPKLCINVD